MTKHSSHNKDWKITLEEGIALVKAESHAIMNDFGVVQKTPATWRDLPKIMLQFSKHNKTPQHFVRNLDAATYDIRERMKWNTKMASQLAMSKLKEKTLAAKSSFLKKPQT